MIYIGIDIAKDKHDCCILGADGEVLVSPFVIENNLRGYQKLLKKVYSIENDKQALLFGAEETGHYGNNLIHYLQQNGLAIKTVNPLLTAKQRQANSLRKTKTDKIDSHQIAIMLRSGVGFYPKVIISQDVDNLKSLTRYRKSLTEKRAKDKIALKRLVNVMFPELEEIHHNIHTKTAYGLLVHYPGKQYVYKARTKSLVQYLPTGKQSEANAHALKKLAHESIGTISEAKSYELKETIERIQFLTEKIDEVTKKIETIMAKLKPNLRTIPGVGVVTSAVILSEIGDISRFSSPNKILAYAGLVPSIYQSGKCVNAHSRMEKRGSRYLRCALFLAAERVCRFEPSFRKYLLKKRAEGKHYYNAISNAARKLVRLIYALETENRPYHA